MAESLSYITLLCFVPVVFVALSLFASFHAFDEMRLYAQSAVLDFLSPEHKTVVEQSINTFLDNTKNLSWPGVVGLMATALALLISYPLACFIAFRGGRWRPLLTGLVVIPFFTASLVRMIGWTTLLADRGPLLGLLRGLGLVLPLEVLGLLQDGRLLNTTPAVVGGLAYNAVPFLVLPLVVTLQRVGVSLLEAAADLQAGPWITLRRVIWPLSKPGLAAGLTLSLVPTVGDVINPQMLGGPNDRLIGNALQNLVLVQRQLPRSAALTVVLMALLALLVLFGLRGGSRDDLPLP